MNRARRSAAVYNKKASAKQQVSDDDFESGDGFSEEADDDDFSVSEDEWLPGKDKKNGGDVEEQGTVSDDENESEDASENEDDIDKESQSDESVVASANSRAKKRTTKESMNPIPKKKRLSPATRDELYQRTKKYLLKEADPERPPLNSSVADILKQCQFKKKKDISRTKPAAKTERVKKYDDGESDSSGDDHLIKPEELDLASKFFDKIEPAKQEPEHAAPQFDCNAGMRLSDSSDDDDQSEEPIPASIQKLAAQQLISKINESSGDFMNFNSLGEFNEKIEEAKAMLKNYQAKKNVTGSQQEKGEDVSNLLALGETEAGISSGRDMDAASQNGGGSGESDWEEVADAKRSQAIQKPSEDYQITVEVQTAKSKKKRWEEIEMELYIKRQINKVKRANQLAFHKSSILCAIAGGKKLNEIVNSQGIQAKTLSMMQSGQCVFKGKLDGKFIDQLMKWFKNKFEITSQQVFGPKTSKFSFTLALELYTKKVACKRDYVLLFLACLRAAGVDCRLVISANVPPKRPSMKDLCPISERQLIEKFEKEFNIRSAEGSTPGVATKDDQEVKIEEKVDEKYIIKNEEISVEKLANDGQKISDVDNVSAKPREVKIEKMVDVKDIIKNEEKSVEKLANDNVSAEPLKATFKRKSTLKSSPGEVVKHGREVKIEIKVEVKDISKNEEKSVEKLANDNVSAEPLKATKKRKSTRKSSDHVESQSVTNDKNTEADTNETKSTKITKSSRLTIPKVQVQENQGPKVRRGRSRSKSIQQCPRDTSSKTLRFSPEPEIIEEQPKSASVSPAKENARTRKSILKRSSPRVANKKVPTDSPSRMPLNSLVVPQLDGVSDLASTPKSVPISRRLRSRVKPTAADSNPGSPFTKRETNTPTVAKEKNNNQPGRISKRKLFDVRKVTEDAAPSLPKTAKPKSSRNKILSSDSSDEGAKPTLKKRQSRGALTKTKKPRVPSDSSEDSDFEIPGKKKRKRARKAKSESPSKQSKAAIKSKPKKVEKEDSGTAANKMDLWIEFYSEKDKRWITVDLFTGKINCVDYLMRQATSPISYVFSFDNFNHIKDITPRYVQHWNMVSRMLRVEPKWLDKALKPFQAKKSAREKQEDEELNKIHIDKPLPTTIAECKNHPLYALKRHLLKFEALYPPDAPSLGFVRGEAIYARECVFVLQTREKWYKQGRVVKPFETAYKVVKCWKYDKLKNEWLKNQPSEIFGLWQTEEYDPPTAENGLVPRNEYGNVELFMPKMLPKKTVHLQLPGLNRVCRRLGIDCAQALIGFDKARMRVIPVYDGFVVCEEFANQVVEEWYKEMEEDERREQEKYEKRVYGNWKRLIKGLLLRRKLQNKYNFDNL